MVSDAGVRVYICVDLEYMVTYSHFGCHTGRITGRARGEKVLRVSGGPSSKGNRISVGRIYIGRHQSHCSCRNRSNINEPG